MSQNSDEGNQTQPTGDAEQPTSPTSGGAGQPLPDTLKLVLDRLEKTEKLVQGLQKGTDKQISSVRNDVKRILELKEQGLNEPQIQRELYIDSLMTGQSAAPAEPVGKQEPSGPDPDVENTLKAMQFDENDVALAALKVLHGNNQAGLLKAAANLRINQLAQKPAGPAGALPPSGGQSGSRTAENPIQNINESRDLYRIAAQEFKKTPRA